MIVIGRNSVLNKKRKLVRPGEKISEGDVDKSAWDYLVKNKLVGNQVAPVEAKKESKEDKK